MFIEVEAAEELILAEQLQVFDIIEHFCDICGDITPHHCEDRDNMICVPCRESEEKKLNLNPKDIQ